MLTFVHSNSVDELAQSLLEAYENQLSQGSLTVFDQFYVLVPSSGFRTWLTRSFARKLGVAAQINMQLFGSFKWGLEKKVLELSAPEQLPKRLQTKAKSRLSIELTGALSGSNMRWKLLNFFLSGSEASQQLYAELSAHELSFERASFLATELSRVYADYLTHRPDWVRGWSQQDQPLPLAHMLEALNQLKLRFHQEVLSETDLEQQLAKLSALEATQRRLWRELFAELHLDLLAVETLFWQQITHVKSEVLPPLLSVMTEERLPVSALQFLLRLSQHTQVLFLNQTPSQEFFADVVDPDWSREQALIYPELAQFKDTSNPLLAKLGKQARDRFRLLAQLSGNLDQHYLVDNLERYQHCQESTALSALKRSVLNLDSKFEPPSASSAFERWQDQSLRIHACSHLTHQLTVLREDLALWLHQDSSRSLSDVLILAPNLEQHASLICSVLEQSSEDQIKLAVRATGLGDVALQEVWQAFSWPLKHEQNALSLSTLSGWLLSRPVQQQWQLSAEDARRCVWLLEQAGFRRGLGQDELRQTLSPYDNDYRHTLEGALVRLSLGLVGPHKSEWGSGFTAHPVALEDAPLVECLLSMYALLCTAQQFAAELRPLCSVYSDPHSNAHAQRLDSDGLNSLSSESASTFRATAAESVGESGNSSVPRETLESLDSKNQLQAELSQQSDQQPEQQQGEQSDQQPEEQQAQSSEAHTGTLKLGWLDSVILNQLRELQTKVPSNLHVARLIQMLVDLIHCAKQLQADQLSLAQALQLVDEALHSQVMGAEPSHAVTLAPLGTLRNMPFKLIVLLDMGAQSLNAAHTMSQLNLMKHEPMRLGDMQREDDQNATFLEALLAAKEALWLFYPTGTQSAKPQLPARQLMDLGAFLTQQDTSLVTTDLVQQLKDQGWLAEHHPDPMNESNYQPKPGQRQAGFWWRLAFEHSGAAQLPVFADHTAAAAAYPTQGQAGLEPLSLNLTELVTGLKHTGKLYFRAHGLAVDSEAQLEPDLEPLESSALDLHYLQVGLTELDAASASNGVSQFLPKQLKIKSLTPAGVQGAASVNAQNYRLHTQLDQALEYIKSAHDSTKVHVHEQLEAARVKVDLANPCATAELWAQVPTQHSVWLQRVAGSSDKHKWRLEAYLNHVFWCSLSLGASAKTSYVLFKDRLMKLVPLSAQAAAGSLAEFTALYLSAQQQPLVLPLQHSVHMTKDLSSKQALTKVPSGWLKPSESEYAAGSECCTDPVWSVMVRGADPEQLLEQSVVKYAELLFQLHQFEHCELLSSQGASA